MSPGELSVVIAPHLQRGLEAMSRDMAVPAQALVNQAVFAWLRINGYVVPGTAGDVAASTAPAAEVARPEAAVAPPPAAAETVAARPKVVTDPHARPTAPEAVSATAQVPAAAPPAPEPSAGLGPVVARIEEIEADLARYTKPRPPFPVEPSAEAEDDQAPEARDEAEGEDSGDEGQPDAARESAALSSAGAGTGEGSTIARAHAADELEDDEPTRGVAPADEEGPSPEGTFVVRSVPVVLYVERDGEEAVRVEADRFIIGRGPTCDLIIDSPRVSREHVRIARQGVTFVIEDLGSSNGTWFGEERVQRREVESGDEYLLGNERVRLVLRGE
ncbi:MAG: FHA domain-containing protein [Myxococcota bacterium]